MDLLTYSVLKNNVVDLKPIEEKLKKIEQENKALKDNLNTSELYTNIKQDLSKDIEELKLSVNYLQEQIEHINLYINIPKIYKCKFIVKDDVLSEKTVFENTLVNVDINPEDYEEGDYIYTFSRWEPSVLNPITSNTTFRAIYIKNKKEVILPQERPIFFDTIGIEKLDSYLFEFVEDMDYLVLKDKNYNWLRHCNAKNNDPKQALVTFKLFSTVEEVKSYEEAKDKGVIFKESELKYQNVTNNIVKVQTNNELVGTFIYGFAISHVLI